MDQNKNSNKILISSCLLGHPVRYDGQTLRTKYPILNHWFDLGMVIEACPEVLGGLGCPRLPSEIQNESSVGKKITVLNLKKEDVTQFFINGALETLKLCKQHNIKIAIFKADSPSCSNSHIYDGSFTGKLIAGKGITVRILEESGITVFNENQINDVLKVIRSN